MKKNNYIYLYNDNFLSLLTLIKTLWQNKIIPANIKNSNYQQNLFDEVINLSLKEDDQLIKDIQKYLSKEILKTMFYVYLSENPQKELILFYFFGYSVKYKNKVFYYRNITVIDKVLKICKYVSNESHKLKGFVRFRELQNKVLYAEIAPSNNVLILLSQHFKNRLKNEFWIIKDVNRGILSIYDKKEFYLVSEENVNIATLNSTKEELVEELWQSFYKTIGIKERKNDRCRLNFMPKKYWKYILEVSDEL